MADGGISTGMIIVGGLMGVFVLVIVFELLEALWLWLQWRLRW